MAFKHSGIQSPEHPRIRHKHKLTASEQAAKKQADLAQAHLHPEKRGYKPTAHKQGAQRTRQQQVKLELNHHASSANHRAALKHNARSLPTNTSVVAPSGIAGIGAPGNGKPIVTRISIADMPKKEPRNSGKNFNKHEQEVK